MSTTYFLMPKTSNACRTKYQAFGAWKDFQKHRVPTRIHYAEAEFYLQHDHEIYQLNSEAKDKPLDKITKIREKMAPHFEAMKSRAMEKRVK